MLSDAKEWSSLFLKNLLLKTKKRKKNPKSIMNAKLYKESHRISKIT